MPGNGGKVIAGCEVGRQRLFNPGHSFIGRSQDVVAVEVVESVGRIHVPAGN